MMMSYLVRVLLIVASFPLNLLMRNPLISLEI